MINKSYYQSSSEPFPCRLYIQERETELAVAEYTIHEANEAFQYLRQDYHKLLEHASMLEEILHQNGIPFPETDE